MLPGKSSPCHAALQGTTWQGEDLRINGFTRPSWAVPSAMVEVGQKVQIVSGHFAGSDATVLEVGVNAIRVRAEVFGRPLEINVTPQELGISAEAPVGSLDALLRELDERYRDAAPVRYSLLRDGAHDDITPEARETLGVDALPDELTTLYAWRDGMRHDGEGWPGDEYAEGHPFEPVCFDSRHHFISRDGAVDLAAMWTDIVAGEDGAASQPRHWRRGFIPLLQEGSYGLTVIDTTGLHTGAHGQLLRFDYKAREDYVVVAESVRHWLAGIVMMLREGVLFADPDGQRRRIEEAVHGAFWGRVGRSVPLSG